MCAPAGGSRSGPRPALCCDCSLPDSRRTPQRIRKRPRYTQWILLPPDAPEPPPGSQLPPLAPANVALFERALGSVLARVADRNRHVQQSACSSLAVMEEHAGGRWKRGTLNRPTCLRTGWVARGGLNEHFKNPL
jgi:hypothetical protein